MNSLKLVALDRDDLEIVSAHLQDALIKPADIRWRPSEQRLVIGSDFNTLYVFPGDAEDASGKRVLRRKNK